MLRKSDALTKRVISSAVLIAVCAAALYSDLIFAATALGITALGLYEFYAMLEKKGINIFKYFGIGMGVMIPASILFQFELTKGWELLFIVLAFLFLIIMQFKRRENHGAIVGISTTIFGILYIAWFFSFVIKIRLLPGGTGMLIALLVMTKAGDVGAYLVGAKFGKTPLIPRISPKKSVEGSLGGLAASIAGGLLSRFLMPGSFSMFHMALLGLCVGLLAQLGDLSESLMKRDCGIKDSADVIPGFGGILDLIDSVLFTAPVFYFYITLKNFSF
ncbi:MAG: phosphatidate cytidylyltransferase [Candidatus Omnitrophica bacterium]|jgi:phosphatidate cytidylyltransferase|nr:phosphatidate cytidylyltransferase [Candidatus Omnitrophota bacterium]